MEVEVIFGHGGVGKSCELFENWKQLPRIKKMYMSHSHTFLKHQADRVPRSRHIYGLEWICPCLVENSQFYNPIIVRLKNLKFPNKLLCSVCKELNAYPSDCPYKLQFKRMPNAVFLPIEYAGSKVLEEYRPQIIAVDDCLLRKKEHPTRAKLDFYIKYFSNNKYNLEDLCNMDYSAFEDVLTNLIKLSDDEITKWVVEQIKTNPEDKSVISRITEPEELRAYYHYAKIYDMKDKFATPYLFYLFDYVFEYPKTQLIIIEALPQTLRFLNMLAERYRYETRQMIVFKCREIKFQGQLPKSVIYRCHGDKTAWYPTTSSITTSNITRRAIIERIKAIINSWNGKELPGFIVPKSVKNEFQREFPNAKILTFGDLRGKNELEYNNPLFVVGTYNIERKDILDEFSLWFPNLEASISDELVDDKPHGGRYEYKDEQLDFFRWLKEDYEQYQAVMRCRPLNYPRTIYHFGIVPKEIPEEIKIENLWIKIETLRGGGVVTILEDRVRWLEELVKKDGKIPLEVVVKEFQKTYGDKNVTRVKEKIGEILKRSGKIDGRLDGKDVYLLWKDAYK